jgi:glycosyltransferase involved in cell wall biosynthesis
MAHSRGNLTRRIWIAWETQRRSITLSGRLGADLHILELEHLGIWRYPLSLWRTARLLWGSRGEIVFVQNPSLILAAFAAFWKRFLHYTLVVDRHTNFVQVEEHSALLSRVLTWLSQYSIRRADLTIVTNSEIDNKYIRPIGRGFILPDPYPDVPAPVAAARDNSGALRILFVSSWETDEPIREVAEVCRRLGSNVEVFISGRPKKEYASLVESRPENFVVTGFLSDEDYFKLMASVDCVMAISRWPGTLCCGAYEGVALGKPVILNDEAVTKEYFSSGAVYTNSSADDLEQQMRFVADNRAELTARVAEFRERSSVAWDLTLGALNAEVESLHWSNGNSTSGEPKASASGGRPAESPSTAR